MLTLLSTELLISLSISVNCYYEVIDECRERNVGGHRICLGKCSSRSGECCTFDGDRGAGLDQCRCRVRAALPQFPKAACLSPPSSWNCQWYYDSLAPRDDTSVEASAQGLRCYGKCRKNAVGAQFNFCCEIVKSGQDWSCGCGDVRQYSPATKPTCCPQCTDDDRKSFNKPPSNPKLSKTSASKSVQGRNDG